MNHKYLYQNSLGIWIACMSLGVSAAFADDWPQWLGPNRDGIWRETAIVSRFPESGPPLRWRVPVGGGYSAPAVAGGRVYLTDRQVAPATSPPTDLFQRGRIPGRERVLCFSDADGKLLWEHAYDVDYTMSYPGGPRATPLVAEGKVWTLGAEGRVLCLEATSGRVVWSRDFLKDFEGKTPTWGFAAHPLLDGERLICVGGGTDHLAVALNKNTGELLWHALSAKEPGYCPPTLINVQGKSQVLIWHPEAINGLDPATGKLLWSVPWEIHFGLTVPQPRQVGNRLFFTAFYDGSHLLEFPGKDAAPRTVWKSPKRSEKDTWALHSIMPTPFVVDDHIYGVCSYGQLRCLRLADGERVWETFDATTGKAVRWANAFLIRHQDRFFLFNELGDLILAHLTPDGYHEISRAHLIEPTSDASGRKVVWSYPAFANKSVYVRNDKELAVFSLAAP